MLHYGFQKDFTKQNDTSSSNKICTNEACVNAGQRDTFFFFNVILCSYIFHSKYQLYYSKCFLEKFGSHFSTMRQFLQIRLWQLSKKRSISKN